jgi:hypothetical protein
MKTPEQFYGSLSGAVATARFESQAAPSSPDALNYCEFEATQAWDFHLRLRNDELPRDKFSMGECSGSDPIFLIRLGPLYFIPLLILPVGFY